MGTLKGPTEGGSGGKRGHSNMEHWVCSDELKEAMRRRRRLNAQREIREELTPPKPDDVNASQPNDTDE